MSRRNSRIACAWPRRLARPSRRSKRRPCARGPPSLRGPAGRIDSLRPRAATSPMARFYITTAIDYVNNRPHLGTAYEKIAADIIARYHRLIGDDVRFVMGNDEHSQNVFRRAKEQGLDPLAYCDRMEGEFRKAWKHLNISFDDFI